uniref:Uncharacterized protein n=1 Tax=Lactuca sativa TaxID=4236 RepID=A0A9R1ULH7_LACSA|nr:hypothetical protein LSAT_V11C800448380 [Lactuca sativa]
MRTGRSGPGKAYVRKCILGNSLSIYAYSCCACISVGDKFQHLSTEGEKITASSSGPANPTSQSSSERAARPTLDANLDTFLSSGPAFTLER